MVRFLAVPPMKRSANSCFDYFRPSVSVALKAMEVLTAGRVPSYEECAVQMEIVLKASATASYYGEKHSRQR